MSVKNAAEVGVACMPKARPRPNNRRSCEEALKDLELEKARQGQKDAEEALRKARQEVEDRQEVMAEMTESMTCLEAENTKLLERLMEAQAENARLLERLTEAQASIPNCPTPEGVNVKDEVDATAAAGPAGGAGFLEGECLLISDSDESSGSGSSSSSSQPGDWRPDDRSPGEGEGGGEGGGAEEQQPCSAGAEPGGNGSYSENGAILEPGERRGEHDNRRDRSRSPHWLPAPRTPCSPCGEQRAAAEESTPARSLAGSPGNSLHTEFGHLDLRFIRREAAKAKNWDPTECPAENKDYPRSHVSVLQLKFTHNNVGGAFGHGKHQGRPIKDLTDSLISGQITAKELPPMVVFRREHTECWVVMGNRRLKALKDAARVLQRPLLANCIIHDVPWLPLVCKFLLAKTTENDGRHAVLRPRRRPRRPRGGGPRPARPAGGARPYPWCLRGAGRAYGQ